jgi:formate hydrogenlyase transcriptional activator
MAEPLTAAAPQTGDDDTISMDCARRRGAAVIGKSGKFSETLKQSELVAPTDCTVLILGETGTGKELVARLVHGLSPRRNRPLIKVNCAAIPSGLLESELFGHERGAFTGAVNQRIGRFEAAHNGTLFLDEVGDIPLEVQPKLLRVLQEQEFERLGSGRTLRTNVRLIAATHRDLAGMVSQDKFREDLFYRINVFPVNVPALRERVDDIPDLMWHFTKIYAQKFGREIETIHPELLAAAKRYEWPGNVRELENFVERAVITSNGHSLVVSASELIHLNADSSKDPVKLVDVERAHIAHILDQVSGELTRAASVLGIPRTTLFYKIRRLGISSSKSRRNRTRQEHASSGSNVDA